MMLFLRTIECLDAEFLRMENVLDDFDHAILRIVQANNQRGHADIGEAVSLSASAVRRRLIAMREAGIIRHEVALVNPDDFGTSLILSVAFMEERRDKLSEFREKIASLDPITHCYSVAGEIDFVLIVSAPSLRWYEDWVDEHFTHDPNIRRVSTQVAWSCWKHQPAIDTRSAEGH